MKNIGKVILIISMLFWAGCGVKGKSPASVAEVLYEETQSQMKALFPEDDVPGWRRSEEITFFQKTNLFEHINGAAEAFFAYGFQLCGTVDYTSDSASDDFIRVDVYDMGRSIQAFGMYASERYPGPKTVDIGAEGYIEPPMINFWKSAYYIKISASAPSENLTEVGLRLAEHIARKIPGKAEKPSMLSLLPREGLIPDTERFILNDILGYNFLSNGVMANYRIGNVIETIQELSLLIMECASVDDAKDRYTKFAQYEEASGSMTKIADLGDEGFTADDKYYKRLMVVRQGRYIIMTLAVTSDIDAGNLIRKAIRNLTRVPGT